MFEEVQANLIYNLILKFAEEETSPLSKPKRPRLSPPEPEPKLALDLFTHALARVTNQSLSLVVRTQFVTILSEMLEYLESITTNRTFKCDHCLDKRLRLEYEVHEHEMKEKDKGKKKGKKGLGFKHIRTRARSLMDDLDTSMVPSP
ncbi:hypothetical protein QAD02_018350 [Eretmocerus hayati]|uniref:Uncharacterized protein n=1 Tax=Eretmocerus hayati TaxID=131215 RepID=A0ACC2PHQ6_9HYME|nr:hypothetical protein QAD02_018350 [Eretmocerus hayati]